MKSAKQRSLSTGKVYINWSDYIEWVMDLIDIIEKSGIKFDYVCGIPRGGLIPAAIISHQLNIKMLLDLSVANILEASKILIVDDICDSGETLKPYVGVSHIKMATLFKNVYSPVTPDFYCKETKDWIVFPYEMD